MQLAQQQQQQQQQQRDENAAEALPSAAGADDAEAAQSDPSDDEGPVAICLDLSPADEARLGFPKRPLVKCGNAYYRAGIIAVDWTKRRVRLSYDPAHDPPSEHFALNFTNKRIWRGSYKAAAWERVGMGAWVPLTARNSCIVFPVLSPALVAERQSREQARQQREQQREQQRAVQREQQHHTASGIAVSRGGRRRQPPPVLAQHRQHLEQLQQLVPPRHKTTRLKALLDLATEAPAAKLIAESQQQQQQHNKQKTRRQQGDRALRTDHRSEWLVTKESGDFLFYE